jgi:hypothetical protein
MVSSIPWPTAERPFVKVTNIHPDTWEHYRSKFKSYTVTENELKEVQQGEIQTKLATDDVRGLGKIFRDAYKLQLKQMGVVTWRKVNFHDFPMDGIVPANIILNSLTTPSQLANLMRSPNVVFGAWKKIEQWWTETQLLATVRRIKPASLLRDYSPGAWADMRKLERAGLHRAVALDFIFGKIAGVVATPVSPLISSAVQSMLSTLVTDRKWTREMWAWFVSTIGAVMAQNLDASRLSQELYQW